MKIYPLSIYTNYKRFNTENSKPENKIVENNLKNKTNLIPNTYMYPLLFGARVDKGLERFYEANKDRMPLTVSEYIENLDDKSSVSPLEAHKKAFELLEISQTIDDIKSAYPNEPLFRDLINPGESRATRGILNSVKENEELLALGNQGVLKDKSNLTVYLVKKVFLENKTIEEINADLEKDLDDDFKADFKFKNEKSQYIYTSTLSSLGIKPPKPEYRQSLRYTLDGYSDAIGEKISAGQRAFWDSMPPEERTARNKKSVEKFENWWYSHTKNEILDMIAAQTTALEMLNDFKKFQRGGTSKPKSKSVQQENPVSETSKPVKTGSDKLSRDELFIKWATNNLKLYVENLSEAEKDTLHIKRMQRLVTRWEQMSPEARTDYISKLKSGSEPLRYTMIDAWNHSTDLIKDLSVHLRQNQIYKPSDLLYSTEAFSSFQSRVMTEFWEQHPHYTDLLGKTIINSQKKVQAAISNGTFEELKKQIMRDKNQRVKELDKFKQNAFAVSDDSRPHVKPDYILELKNVYTKVLAGQLKNLPQEYIDDYFNVIEKDFSREQVEAWIRNLNGEPALDGDYELLTQISKTESNDGAKINRAIEAALADVIYKCTGDAVVYKLSHSDLKVSLAQIARGENCIDIISHKLKERFSIPIKNRAIDQKRIAMLYHQYKQPLDEKELEFIVTDYFFPSFGAIDNLMDYLATYGRSLNIIFSEKSSYPKEVKQAMFEKFMDNRPDEISEIPCLLTFGAANDPFGREEKIKKAKYMFAKRFNFVPQIYMDRYLREIGSLARMDISGTMLEDFVTATQRRSDINSSAKLAIFKKNKLRATDALRTLAIEEALADVLYEATGNIDVYKLEFEELCDNIELFSSVKKFPSSTRYFTAQNGEAMELSAKKRPNTANLRQKYLDYINEIVDWSNTDVKEGRGTFEDLLFILNPDENMPQKDEAVSQRIKLYNLNLK